MDCDSPFIWIVVLNWNGLADTLGCLESLGNLHYTRRHIVVVDNGSSDGSVDALHRAAAARPEIEILEAGSNLGYAGGNNLGIRRALDGGADFILLLNNDTTVDGMLLDEFISAAERSPKTGCFGAWIFHMHEPDRLWFTQAEWTAALSAFTMPGKGKLVSELAQVPTRTEYVCGAALFFRANVARRIGLLDERFFLVYEDSDWCFRARRAGFECSTVPSARVWHKVGTSFGSEASPLRTYFSSRNKLLWAEKNLPRSEWWRILRGAVGRLYPASSIESGVTASPPKALLWAATTWLRGWSRKARDPQEVAHRRGVVDYLLRRFGDCPPKVRALTKDWSSGNGVGVPTSIGG
jgi:GT2 family glycosyltransferase